MGGTIKKERKMAETNFGYNLADESVKLFLTQEVHSNTIIDGKNKQVEGLINRMEKLEEFLALVASRTDDSSRVDLMTAEEMAMVDGLREQEGLAHIFPHGKYSWKEAEIENLRRMINQHVEGPLSRKLTQTTEEIMLEQQEQSKAVELFNSGLKRMNNLIERIMNNIQRAH